MKKIIMVILTAALALPMIASVEKETVSTEPVFHAWASMWGKYQEPKPEDEDQSWDGPFKELPEVIDIPGLNAISLGFMGWDKNGNLFTAWNADKDELANEWLERPSKGSNGYVDIVNPWYWLWTYYEHQNPKIDYYMGAGGWSFGGGDVPDSKGVSKAGPDIWKTLPEMTPGDREKLAVNIADFIKSPSPVYKKWSWWSATELKSIGTAYLSGINLDLETVDEVKGGPGEFSDEMLDAVADLVGHLKNEGVDKIIATVMVKDYEDNMLKLLTNHFDNFYEIHIMAYDIGDANWAKEGYKDEMNAFAEAIRKGTGKKLEEVKGKMVIGLSACKQFHQEDPCFVEPVAQLEKKAKWIVEDGFKGTFLWAVGQTYLVKDQHPGYTEVDIVKAIIRAMH